MKKVLIAPLITEKGTGLREQHNQYVFEVGPDATKIEIRQAVEKQFKVKVTAVRILRRPGKLRRVRVQYGMTAAKKKAIVTLADGQNIAGYETV
ncbi:MAG TPA: 50S ribosomal protein L23 [bacterium]|nr:50S ribosomal protein L23 [bacterium]